MQINVSQQLRASTGSVWDYEVSGVVDIAGGSRLVQGEVRLIRTNRGILAKARLNAEIEVTCDRCLNLFSCSLSLDFEEECFPTADVVSGKALPVPEESGCFTIDEHHVLDLTEAIRQYALLAIKMKPLCREDCAGLCSLCGHDLNQGPCGCLPQEVDSRWSKLNKLARERNE